LDVSGVMFMGQMGQYVEASVRDTTLMWIIGQSEIKGKSRNTMFLFKHAECTGH